MPQAAGQPLSPQGSDAGAAPARTSDGGTPMPVHAPPIVDDSAHEESSAALGELEGRSHPSSLPPREELSSKARMMATWSYNEATEDGGVALSFGDLEMAASNPNFAELYAALGREEEEAAEAEAEEVRVGLGCGRVGGREEEEAAEAEEVAWVCGWA
eukprot:256117-Chlamydomonas_euryale.AAC.2